MDGDQVCDLAVGQPHGWTLVSEKKAGTVYVLGGRDGRVLRHFGYDARFPYFGVSVANAGDLDGDGFPELAVGSNGFGPRGRQYLGWVGIYSTRTWELLRTHQGMDRLSPDAFFYGDQLGIGLASAGDADGDGVPDLLVTAARPSGDPVGRTQYGRVDLRSGRTGALLASFEARQDDSIFGLAAAVLGDLDGDGRSEFLLGAVDSPEPRGPGQVIVARYPADLPRFLRGDGNGDGRVDLSDLIRLVEVLLGDDPGPCPLALDVDGDGRLGGIDPIALISYFFKWGLAPAPPFPDCGGFGGVRASRLGCARSTCPE